MNTIIVTKCRNSCWFNSIIEKMASHHVSNVRKAAVSGVVAAIDRYNAKLVIVDAGSDSNASIIACIDHIKGRYPNIPIFLIVQKSSEALAIGALKAGVDDYFKAPLNIEDFLASMERVFSYQPVHVEPDRREDHIAAKMVGRSKTMTELRDLLNRLAIINSTVLITGETGTGKELAAGLIHENSMRAQTSMVSVNCAALPDNLVESELFGYERGAFTGAMETTPGRFEQANGGTVFLDEIGDMSPFAQAKILRVIEDKQISHLGGRAPIPLDFRLIAATNRDPELLIEEGAFRDDLFYRLNVARVHIPSLRERREDIPLLINYGIRKLNRMFNRNIQGLKKDALDLLYRYEWPGNVRELMNVLEGAFINQPQSELGNADLPAHFKKKLIEYLHLPTDERKRIVTTLIETNWNKSTAAKKLKWSRMTLYRKIARYHIVQKRSLRAQAAKSAS